MELRLVVHEGDYQPSGDARPVLSAVPEPEVPCEECGDYDGVSDENRAGLPLCLTCRYRMERGGRLVALEPVQ